MIANYGLNFNVNLSSVGKKVFPAGFALQVVSYHCIIRVGSFNSIGKVWACMVLIRLPIFIVALCADAV